MTTPSAETRTELGSRASPPPFALLNSPPSSLPSPPSIDKRGSFSPTWQRIRPSFRPESKTIKNEFNFGPPLPQFDPRGTNPGIFIGIRYSSDRLSIDAVKKFSILFSKELETRFFPLAGSENR